MDTGVQQKTRGVELALDKIQVDDEEVVVEVVTGGGETHKFALPPTVTVLMLKQQVERDAGFKSAEMKLYVHDDLREEELENGETLGGLRQGKMLAVLITLIVHDPDAQEVVPRLGAKADLVLGDGTRGDGNGQMWASFGVAFVPAHPDWLVTTEFNSNRVKISNIRTGALICKFGEDGCSDDVFDEESSDDGSDEETSDNDSDDDGSDADSDCGSSNNNLDDDSSGADSDSGISNNNLHDDSSGADSDYGISNTNLENDSGEGVGAGHFNAAWGVIVTSDSSFVIVVDDYNHHIKVLRLVVAADGSSAHLEFVRHIGNGRGSSEGQLMHPIGVALLSGDGGGQETVLVTDSNNNRVSQFKLDGSFIRIFAGTGKFGEGDGEFCYPYGITVLGSSGEVAVTDCHSHRVQIFDREGNYKRQFGSEGKEADGQFECPSAVASDAHGNLLVLDKTTRLPVFSPEGEHLCTHTGE
jgi:hypothetical protein